MNIKLGDLVMRKGEIYDLMFQVTGFDEEYVVLKGIRIPIITICPAEKLIKLNREGERFNSGLKVIK